MKKIHAWLVVLVVGTAAISSAAEGLARDRWLADLDAIESALARGYPNLEWHVQRGMDLVAADRRARERIANAPDAAAARSALERFIAAFGDGHLSLAGPEAQMGSPATPASLCTRLGFRADVDTTAIARGLPGYQPLAEGKVLSAGLLPIGEKVAGVLRVREFAPDLEMCEAAREDLRLAAEAPCGADCEDALRTRASNHFLAAVGAQLEALRVHSPALLLIDLAGNGGGDDTAVALARMLGGDIATPRMAFPKTPAHLEDLREDNAALALARKSARRGAERDFLRGLTEQLAGAAREFAAPCDLMPLWRGEPVVCSNLVSTGFFAGGLLEHEMPPSFRESHWAPVVSATARLQYRTARWDGPIIVVVDGGTASAAELFAAMLQDAGRVRVIGAPTLGAGCGWTLPKNSVVLPTSGARLDMPDCARLRRDGTNELDGIQPDVLVGFRRYDSAAQRARRLSRALEEIILKK
jgi:hypothetical protein